MAPGKACKDRIRRFGGSTWGRCPGTVETPAGPRTGPLHCLCLCLLHALMDDVTIIFISPSTNIIDPGLDRLFRLPYLSASAAVALSSAAVFIYVWVRASPLFLSPRAWQLSYFACHGYLCSAEFIQGPKGRTFHD